MALFVQKALFGKLFHCLALFVYFLRKKSHSFNFLYKKNTVLIQKYKSFNFCIFLVFFLYYLFFIGFLVNDLKYLIFFA